MLSTRFWVGYLVKCEMANMLDFYYSSEGGACWCKWFANGSTRAGRRLRGVGFCVQNGKWNGGRWRAPPNSEVAFQKPACLLENRSAISVKSGLTVG